MLFNETRQYNIQTFDKYISSIEQDKSKLHKQISKILDRNDRNDVICLDRIESFDIVYPCLIK